MRKLILSAILALGIALSAVLPVGADHAWGPYHWASSTTPVNLNVGDNVSSAWDSYLDEAIADWNVSSVIQLNEVTGSTKPKPCKPSPGRIEVCNSKYGNTGWLGIAQIWVSGGEHISQAIAKLNDTYFVTPKYNTPAWRRLVMCQELAHDFGLDHQDENFSNPNLGSCMDYTDDPDGPPSNEHPNQHDFEQLISIYSHLDATAQESTQSGGSGSSNGSDLDAPEQWGLIARRDGKGNPSLYVRNLGNGQKLLTFVIWAD